MPDDIVVGRFLGHDLRLVVAPSEHGHRRVLVTGPLDDRDDWDGVATSLEEFLNRYFEAHGNFFWQ